MFEEMDILYLRGRFEKIAIHQEEIIDLIRDRLFKFPQ